MQAVIGPVAYCTIELDRVNEYPKGAGCIVFCNKESYIKAIATHQLHLKFDDGNRQVGSLLVVWGWESHRTRVGFECVFRWR